MAVNGKSLRVVRSYPATEPEWLVNHRYGGQAGMGEGVRNPPVNWRKEGYAYCVLQVSTPLSLDRRIDDFLDIINSQLVKRAFYVLLGRDHRLRHLVRPNLISSDTSQIPRTLGHRQTLAFSVSPTKLLIPHFRSSASRRSSERRARFSEQWSKAIARGEIYFAKVVLASVKFSRIAPSKSEIREESLPCW